MDWFKKHTDTVIIIGAIASSILWMNGKFNDVDTKFSDLEKEMAIIKTVLIMKGIMPDAYAYKNAEVKTNS